MKPVLVYICDNRPDPIHVANTQVTPRVGEVVSIREGHPIRYSTKYTITKVEHTVDLASDMRGTEHYQIFIYVERIE